MSQTFNNYRLGNVTQSDIPKNEYYEILDLLKNKKKLDIYGFRDKFLKRRIKLKMNEKKITNYKDFIKLLKQDDNEIDKLFHFITVNYTSFYRDGDVYDHFYQEILPKIFISRKPIKVLSAGCSSGEEPYTLSMLLNEYNERKNCKVNFRVEALDVDSEVIRKAQKGEYNKESFKELDKKYIKKYFTDVNDKYIVKSELKRCITFRLHDINKPIKDNYYDVIFCRNVFIYFTNESKEKALTNFYNALKENAYLIIGKTEMMPISFNNKYHCVSNKKKIYQKK
ncbi:protein-glutamate O-methyltransferase CheR [archaeon]|nr:protein-glutamate O-methyltransferase CheR [archaeon]